MLLTIFRSYLAVRARPLQVHLLLVFLLAPVLGLDDALGLGLEAGVVIHAVAAAAEQNLAA